MNKGDFITFCSNIYMRNPLGSGGMFNDLGELYDELTARQEQVEAQHSGGVASKCGTANNRSDEIAFLEYLSSELFNSTNTQCLVTIKTRINDRIAQLRAMR